MTHSQIIKAAKLFKNNSVLPVLDCVAIDKNILMFHDLENCISIPFKTGVQGCIEGSNFIAAMEAFKTPVFEQDKGSNIIITEGKQRIKLQKEILDNYPKMIGYDCIDKMNNEGAISADLLPTLQDALEFTSNDDLRPALTVVLVGSHIVSTDAHRMMFVKMQTALKNEILINKKVIKLMLIFAGEWTVKQYTNKDCHIISVTNNEGVQITYKHYIEKFPDWTAVIPQNTKKQPLSNATINKDELTKAIKTGSKFANTSTNMCVLNFTKDKATYTTQDIDFGKEYSTELTAKFTNDIEIGFNYQFLNSFVNKCGKEISIKYSTPTKAAVIDGKYLLMPLMLANY